MDTYYDTSDWRLHRAEYTCRVRTEAGRAEVTVKSTAEASGGIRRRHEITEPVAADSPKAIAACSGPAGELMRAVAGRHVLLPILELRTTRLVFNLLDATGEVADIAVDSVVIPLKAKSPPATLKRIEVEVDAAAVERARRFVELATATLTLVPAVTSKFQAGLAATGRVATTRWGSIG